MIKHNDHSSFFRRRSRKAEQQITELQQFAKTQMLKNLN